MPETRYFYVVLRIKHWNAVGASYSATGNLTSPLCVPPEFGMGFLPVFPSQEEALEYAEEGDTIIPLQASVREVPDVVN